jgi:hypothetical protein
VSYGELQASIFADLDKLAAFYYSKVAKIGRSPRQMGSTISSSAEWIILRRNFEVDISNLPHHDMILKEIQGLDRLAFEIEESGRVLLKNSVIRKIDDHYAFDTYHYKNAV